MDARRSGIVGVDSRMTEKVKPKWIPDTPTCEGCGVELNEKTSGHYTHPWICDDCLQSDEEADE